MKKISLSVILLVLLATNVVFGQQEWTYTSTQIYNREPNVTFGLGATPILGVKLLVDNPTTPLRVRVSGSTKLLLNTNGGLAVGSYTTTVPANGLHITGEAIFKNKLSFSNNFYLETSDNRAKLQTTSSERLLELGVGNAFIEINDESQPNPAKRGNIELKPGATGEIVFQGYMAKGVYPMVRMKNNGDFIIGTSNNASANLYVNGKIYTREINVENTSWSDFVFASDYKLLPLSEVENYINENQHLPDVPSEKEMLEKGHNLAKMDATLLQKIEELTLYTIEQQKIIEQLLERINKLEKHEKNENTNN